MSVHPNDPHARQIRREQEQKKRELEKQIEARKKAFLEADLSRDPSRYQTSQTEYVSEEDKRARMHWHRERPREGLMWRGKPWFKRSIRPYRYLFVAALIWVLYQIVSSFLDGRPMMAIFFLPFIWILGLLISMTYVNKEEQ